MTSPVLLILKQKENAPSPPLMPRVKLWKADWKAIFQYRAEPASDLSHKIHSRVVLGGHARIAAHPSWNGISLEYNTIKGQRKGEISYTKREAMRKEVDEMSTAPS
ncbi:expressed protein [Echinococcus multilocularis]|uniref:Expressed protein n=1 Tax=Echinococcus multilocularis TaxID=6211 RepID=A0A068YLS0_ECHMU|nr:expressed protein [Echinococcus multilocularis]